MNDQPRCELCGEPMPKGEEMFKIHGYSCECPKPPLPKPTNREPFEALSECVEALDSIWAAIGDALCSGKGIEKAYANGVANECRRASDRARAALAASAERPSPVSTWGASEHITVLPKEPASTPQVRELLHHLRQLEAELKEARTIIAGLGMH